MTLKYQIVWDNGHASGTLAGSFATKREAERYARAWKRGMLEMEPAAERAAARAAYSWEIVISEPAA